ncbi:MAG TPA: DUF4349 domain-containing protein [Anaerolineae bacterium]
MNATRRPLFRNLTAMLLGLMMISACGAAATPQSFSNQAAPQAAGVANAPAGAPELKSAVSDTTASSQVATRLIVRNATLTLIVKDTQLSLSEIAKMATDLGGYVSSSSSHKYEEGVQGQITLRVPVEKLDSALDSLHKMAVEVRDEQVAGQDVTAEYTDLNSQLTNLQAAELQLREIMSQTTRVDDVLTVYNQLVQKRGEIEQVKGRIQYLSQSAALATITVTLTPDQLAQPLQIAGWHPEGVLKSAVEALVSGLQTVATIAIWLVVVVLPIGLIIASPFVIIIVLLRRRNRRKPQLAMPVADAQPK